MLPKFKTDVGIHLSLNLLSNAWSAILLLLSTPIFIKFLGVEAYAIIGLYTVIFSFATLLDIGLSSTLSREFASIQSDNDIFRALSIFTTLEKLSYLLGFVACLIIGVTIPFSIDLWMGEHTLSDDIIKTSLILISILVGIRLPLAFYSAGILGLDKQVALNIFSIVSETLRLVIPLIGFYYFDMNVIFFFVVQITITLIAIVVYRTYLRRQLPQTEDTIKFNREIVKSLYPYMKGIGLTNIFWLISSQLDKVILIKLVSLESYGYYTIASSLAASLGNKFIMPVYQAFFPKLVANAKDESEMTKLYHTASKVMAIINFPIMVTVAFWSDTILQLWIGSAAIHVAPLVSILVFFTVLNAAKWIPYATQLAYGWTSLSLYGHILMCLCLPIFIIIGFKLFQLTGVAYAVVSIYGIYIVFTQYFFHKKYLINEKWKWYFDDFLRPVFIVIFINFLIHICYQKPDFLVDIIKIWFAWFVSTFLIFCLMFRSYRMKLFNFFK